MTKDPILKLALRMLVILNVLDACCTLVLVGFKFTTEANPIMDLFLQKGPLIFGLVKLIVTLTSVGLLWLARNSKWALPASLCLVGIFQLVVGIQFYMVATLPWGK